MVIVDCLGCHSPMWVIVACAFRCRLTVASFDQLGQTKYLKKSDLKQLCLGKDDVSHSHPNTSPPPLLIVRAYCAIVHPCVCMMWDGYMVKGIACMPSTLHTYCKIAGNCMRIQTFRQFRRIANSHINVILQY